MKKLLLLIIMLWLLLILPFISCIEESSVEQTLEEKLQQALDNGLNKSNGKGISAAIILPDGTSWVGVSGFSHGTTPITPDMRFGAGSITKMFTATIIIQLAEKGILALDDPLYQWIPEKYSYVDQQITLRHLLNHTSGLYDCIDNKEFWTAVFAEPDKFWNPGDAINQFNRPPLFAQGTGWNYSSVPGYALLRMMIPRITGKDIPTVSENRIWIPFGMDSTFVNTGGDLPGNIAHCWFDQNGDGVYDDFSAWPRTAMASSIGGEVFSTAGDLAKWARALFHDRTVFSQPILDQMLDFHSPCTGEEEMCAGYGLGTAHFNPERFYGHYVIGHSGNALGYAAACLYLPDYGISIGFMDNTEEGEAMMTINDLLLVVIEYLEEKEQ